MWADSLKNNRENEMEVVFGFVVLAFALFVYLLPTYVAWAKTHANLAAIAMLNVLLGWTFIGWVVALVWAMSKPAVITVVVPPSSSSGAARS
jgi:hypothetical protein